MSSYKNKKILVTGGTGTIGQHLIRRLLQDQPAVIRVFSRDEYKQFEMQQIFNGYKNIRYLIGDIRDVNRLSRAMEDIDYVFHLAAMKQVPACEYNPFEAVQTNIVGTQNVIQAAIQNNISKVLFTSTDKAISPTNTYGATKLTAERLISTAGNQMGSKRTVFTSVRFGNVMGSRGSVIPLFIKQIINDRKITVTNPEMVRYMMTPNQAIELIVKAHSQAMGGEVFVLKMPVIKLGDLAEVLIEEVRKRYKIQESILIETIGIRRGEKNFEELMTDEEKLRVIETEEMFILPSNNKFAERMGQEMDISDHTFERTPIHKETLRKWLLEEQLV
ncbi:SDR family NAD(P)-dependent oxidoreductase [Cohnella thailandensis]|uniref:SDR family NAD(P)-dependent oxidoreductase n=1 Tax=Cohnella thailandensis TaxID=557557 RepID=A0A841SV70_9BACL|nr:SDR family NAD(P)-dependent oxidoreductase [Cohnella thailandensis]MBB6632581.1 SDR family NAD(P)-dependent oxidoreductase [Cohnella thailandensis]MBP1971875.1 FlaA1/EpsC-like NDP-sugar epimerase [Cohnella thailandensis]